MLSDFIGTEIEAVKEAVDKRWVKESIEVHQAEIEIVKHEGTEETHPALVWEASNSTFMILKTAPFTYQSFFYYAQEAQRYDTGVNQYNDLYECTSKLLKAQANFVLSRSNQ